jgi:hypothetical protein
VKQGKKNEVTVMADLPIRLRSGCTVVPVPDGYDHITLLRHNFHPATAVAVGPLRRPIMLIGEQWEEISYVR